VGHPDAHRFIVYRVLFIIYHLWAMVYCLLFIRVYDLNHTHTIHHTPYTIHHTPYTIHHKPHTLSPKLQTLHHKQPTVNNKL